MSVNQRSAKTGFINLKDFQPEKILDYNTLQKKLSIQGTFKTNNAILTLEKKCLPDSTEEIIKMIRDPETVIEEKHRTDNQCHYYLIMKENETKAVYATITCPASKRDLAQYNIAQCWFIDETPELYEKVTLERLNRYILAKVDYKWVDFALEGKGEKLIYNDENEKTGFILLKDSKWHNDEISQMNILAFTRQKELMTIRDLRGKHLSLLKNIKEEGSKVITKLYKKVSADQLRIYFHYLPSTYRLHLHFTTDCAERAETLVDRVHLLSTVINNIELDPDYYKRATITIRLCEKYLYKLYIKQNFIRSNLEQPPQEEFQQPKRRRTRKN